MKTVTIAIVLGVVILIIVGLSNSMFMEELEDVSNLTLIEGSVTGVEYYRPNKRVKDGNHPFYRFALANDSIIYRLRSEYSTCFDFNKFKTHVDLNDRIEFRKTEHDGIRNGSIVSVRANGIEFMDLACINSNR